jgi:hypothetical protein
MAHFDKQTLAQLSAQDEIAIRTGKHPDKAVPIWVAVADGEVFVRSVRGAQGRWYRDVAERAEATVEFAGHALSVRAVPAADAQSVERASREYLRKYERSPYAQSVVRAEVLPTTLRLEPR